MVVLYVFFSLLPEPSGYVASKRYPLTFVGVYWGPREEVEPVGGHLTL